MRTPWIVALDVFCCVYSYWPYRWSCWRSLRRRCYPAAAATPIRFTILLLWLLHPSKVSDISHFKSPFPPLRTRRLELLPHPWLDGWMEFFLLLLYDLYNILLDVGFLFISTRLSSTNGTDSLNLLLLHRSRSSNRDAILLYPPSGWGFDLLLLPCWCQLFFIFIFSDRLQFSRAGPISCLQHRLTRNYSDNFNSWSKSSVNLKIDFDYKVCVSVLISMIPQTSAGSHHSVPFF